MNEETKYVALRLWAKEADIPAHSKYDCFEAGWDAAMVKFKELLNEHGSDSTDTGSAEA